ncbi:MAG: hypothetical protein WBS18_08885 [Candidatus Acidiferrales bacterium]
MEPIPRKLTLHQKAVLIQALLAFPGQRASVCYDSSASDALAYADDFLTVFKVSGWSVNDAAPSATLNGRDASLTLVVRPEEGLPPSAEALRDVLRIYGIEVATFHDPAYNVKSEAFTLAIGPQVSAVPEISTSN